MDKKVVTAAIVGLIVGAIGGFMITNSLNRSEMNSAMSNVANVAASTPGANRPDDQMNISLDEIKAKIAEADANPTNLGFQKGLGVALYRYGTLKRDADIVTEAIRLLERAQSIDAKDYDVIVALGNSYFDLGYFKKESANLKKSRDFYKLALLQRPKDADVMTDLALSYFLDEPSDLPRSLEEFQKALTANPKHERALTYLTQTYMLQGKFDEAGRSLEKLKAANPKNESIEELARLIAAKEAPAVK